MTLGWPSNAWKASSDDNVSTQSEEPSNTEINRGDGLPKHPQYFKDPNHKPLQCWTFLQLPILHLCTVILHLHGL